MQIFALKVHKIRKPVLKRSESVSIEIQLNSEYTNTPSPTKGNILLWDSDSLP